VERHRVREVLASVALDDLFVHACNLQPGSTLSERQTIAFDLGAGHRSEEAKNLPTV
jgi:cold shock CspA family protein